MGSWLPRVLVLLAVATGVLGSVELRLNSSISLPIHYDVQLTIDVVRRSFSAEQSILITVLEDTQVIEINANELDVPWMNSRLTSAAGRIFQPISWDVDEETNIVSLRFAEVIPGEPNYTLQMNGVRGIFGTGLVEGHVQSVGESADRYLLSTGFHRTNLRAVFPCYDEPMFRTTYEFTVYHPEAFNLITNSDQVTREGPIPQRNNFIRSTFRITDLLPTTSVAFALTNMVGQFSTDNRIRVYHPDPQTATILLNNYHPLLLAVEEEFRKPLEFPKIDIIYVPSLTTNIITKWGIVFIGPEMNPVENSVVHSLQLKEIQKEIARSVYQLFLGHLVNPEWWSDQWVLLGLSRYFAGVSNHLPFDAEKEFVVDTVQRVIRDHYFFPIFWMGRRYDSIDEINNANEFVVDVRPGALMRMIANVLGRSSFRATIVDFISINRYSSVTEEQFRLHLDRYTTGVFLPHNRRLSEVIRTYSFNIPDTERLRVSKNANNTFNIFRLTTEYVDLPIDFQTTSDKAASRPLLWMEPASNNRLLDVGVQPWVAVNPEQYGLYVVDYTDDLWEVFARELATNHENFNRGQLITDCFTQVRSFRLHLRNYMNLIRYLPKEKDIFTWRAVRISYERLSMLMRGYEGDMEPFYNYFNSLTSDVYLMNRIGREMNDFEMTMEVAKMACYSGQSDCVEDVESYYAAAMGTGDGVVGSGDFQTFIYCSLARNTKNMDSLVDQVIQLWVTDRSVVSQARNAIRGLACTSEIEVINRFLDTVVTDRFEQEHGIVVSPLEREFLLYTFMRGSLESVTQSLQYILQHFAVIQERVDSVQNLFVDFRYYIRPQSVEMLLNQITSTHQQAMGQSLHHFIVIEGIIGQSLFHGDNVIIHRHFSEWLAEQPNTGNMLNAFNILVLVTITLGFRRLL